ncbi:MAG: IS66 family transposase [Butyrivibrio sp.]|nr:IS66 family transposase [Butyrivibrio sp.]
MSEQDIAKLVDNYNTAKDNYEAAMKENQSLHAENATLKEEMALMQSQLDWFKKQMFGRKSEQSTVIFEGGEQLSFMPDEKAASAKTSEETITVPEHKRKKKRTFEEAMADLPVEKVIHELEEKTCDKCGEEMVEIGEEKRDELVYTPARFHIRRHIIKVYKCKKCGSDPEKDAELDDIEPCHIVKAYCQKPMIPGSYCSPELLAHIIFEKYGKAVPLHRQEKDFASKRIPLLKATMSNWVLTAAEQWCLPVVEKMTGQLFLSEVIHADETVVQVLHEGGRKATSESRMWVYCNGKINDRSIVIFDYKPTRKGANAEEFLKGWSGYLVRDQFSGYHVLKNVNHCGCWAHMRRRFIEAIPSDKKLHSTSVAVQAVERIKRIYHEEGLLKNCTSDERYKERQKIIKPLIDEFFAWLEPLPVSGKNKLAEAIGYAINEKAYLYTFLENGNVPMDNNRAENAIRPFAVGRKNWLFSNTARGADCSAALYSIVSTAQANGLDAEKYLTELFRQPAGTIILPWKEEISDDT